MDLKNTASPINQWILEKLKQFKENTFQAFEKYRFDNVAQNITRFLREVFCDVYIECLKPCFSEAVPNQDETRNIAGFVFTEFLKIAHPMLPFVTEFLWKVFAPENSERLLISKWEDFSLDFRTNHSRFANLAVNLAKEIRSLRGVLNVPLSTQLDLYVKEAQSPIYNFLKTSEHWMKTLGNINNIHEYSKQNGLKIVVEGCEFYLEYPASISDSEIRSIIIKKIRELSKDCDLIAQKVANQAYKLASFEKWQEDYEKLQRKKLEIQKMEAAMMD
jgi:valyl-tRNA synthetase